ncbi:MAG: recombinase family protein [Dermatophilaceae bacterium]
MTAKPRHANSATTSPTSTRDEGGSRLALDRLLTDVRAGAVSVLLVASLDRLGRTVRALMSIMDTLHDAQVSLYVTGYGTVPITDMPGLSILSAIAGYQDATMRDVTR